MRTGEGHTLLNEKELETWLSGLASKHRSALLKSQKELLALRPKLEAKMKKPVLDVRSTLFVPTSFSSSSV